MVTNETAYLLAAEAAGFLLAALTARAALAAWRMTRARPLGLFAAGFAALALAQGSAAGLEYATARAGPVVAQGFDVLDALFWLYYAAALAGFMLVFLSFGRHPFRWSPALWPVLLRAGPVLQLALVVVVFFVVLHAGLNHIARARPGSLQTAAGFFLLLVGQFLFLYASEPLTLRTLEGEAASLVGYLLLYRAAARPRGTD